MKLKTRVPQGHVLRIIQFRLDDYLHGNNRFIRRKVNTNAEKRTSNPRAYVNWSSSEVLVLFSSLNLFKSLFCGTYINEHTPKGVSWSAAVFAAGYMAILV